MSCSFKFDGDNRSKLVISLKNLLCCEQPNLCNQSRICQSDFADEEKFDQLLVKNYWKPTNHNSYQSSNNYQSSLDAFSRITTYFFRWLFKIIFLPDNKVRHYADLFGIIASCVF